MKYVSTRDNSNIQTYNAVLSQGLSPDGGLFVPKSFPKFTIKDLNEFSKLTYYEIAAEIISRFTGNDFNHSELLNVTKNVYSKFTHTDVAPVVNLGENNYLLELFYGPTLAFKDYAMQYLAADFERIIKKNNQKILILGATSGDTGSAALNAFSKKSSIDIFILFPNGRVSQIQEAQMTSILADGAFPLKVDGNFDDCQNIVKQIFKNLDFKKRLNLTAINSINWARLVPQIVYYFYSALKIISPEEKVVFSVPTGNFGNIYAGWCAYKMGLPIEKLICTSNKNNILTRFFNTGKMEKKVVEKSYSPSMDIQISSNFERLLFDFFEKDSDKVQLKMNEFQLNNYFEVDSKIVQKLRDIFIAVDVNDDQTLETIRLIYNENKIVIDPHTACGVYSQKKVRENFQVDKKTPIISLACAHPAKFPETIEKAIKLKPNLPDDLINILDKPKYSLHGPNDYKTIMSLIEGNRRS